MRKNNLLTKEPLSYILAELRKSLFLILIYELAKRAISSYFEIPENAFTIANKHFDKFKKCCTQALLNSKSQSSF